MGTQTIPIRLNGQVIDDRWFNIIARALSNDFVPRNSSGEPTNDAGTLGTSAYSFLKAFISRGHFKAGNVKMHHSFNGAISPGEGWMLCDGRQVTKTNYDAEHGAGAWDTYIISSPLLNRYLPSMNNKFPVGVSATTKDCVSATPASVGNAGNNTNLAHNHKWFNATGNPATADQLYDSSGNPYNINYTTKNQAIHGLAAMVWPSGRPAISDSYYTNNGGSASKDIKPSSIEMQYYMRII